MTSIEPRYILRAVAKPGQDMKNEDFEILVQVGDKTFDLTPNLIKVEIKAAEKITMLVEVDVSEIEIDMPATLIDKDDNRTEARVKISGSEQDFPLNSTKVDCEIEDHNNDGDVYIKDLTLTADGTSQGNKIEAHTIVKS